MVFFTEGNVMAMKKRRDAYKKNIIADTIIIVAVLIFTILSYNRNSLWQEDLSLWKSASLYSPSKPRPLTNLGFLYYKDRDYTKAETYLLEAIQKNPLYYIAYNKLGLLYKDRGRLKDSKDILIRSLSIVESPNGRNTLGSVYRELGKLESAIKEYNRAIELKGNHPEAINNLANAYLLKGSTTEAIRTFKESIKLNPYMEETHNNLGLTYQQTGNFDLAEKSFLHALDLNTTNYRTYTNLGTLYFTTGSLDKALDYYLKAITVNNGYAKGYQNIGVVFETKKDYKQSELYYIKALKLDPTLNHSKAGLKRIREKLKFK